MEINTRVQVEHTVTEMITGIDIVRTQIKLAMGKELLFHQNDVSLRGHAIEMRINAEDPQNNFMPEGGKTVSRLPFPRRLRRPPGRLLSTRASPFPRCMTRCWSS